MSGLIISVLGDAMQCIKAMKSWEYLEAVLTPSVCYKNVIFLMIFQGLPECPVYQQQSFPHQHTDFCAVQISPLWPGSAASSNTFSIFTTDLAVSSPWPTTLVLSSLLITSDIQLACFDNLISEICVLIWPQPVRRESLNKPQPCWKY